MGRCEQRRRTYKSHDNALAVNLVPAKVPATQTLTCKGPNSRTGKNTYGETDALQDVTQMMHKLADHRLADTDEYICLFVSIHCIYAHMDVPVPSIKTHPLGGVLRSQKLRDSFFSPFLI